MDLSPYVGPTSVYDPHVVKALNVYREYKISFTEFLQVFKNNLLWKYSLSFIRLKKSCQGFKYHWTQ